MLYTTFESKGDFYKMNLLTGKTWKLDSFGEYWMLVREITPRVQVANA